MCLHRGSARAGHGVNVPPPWICLQVLDAALIHLLSHVLSTRDLVMKNNAALKKAKEKGAGEDDELPRDQGFTRPKALILLPFRSCALRVIRRLVQLTPGIQGRADGVGKLERLESEYALDSEDEEEERRSNQKARKKGTAHPDHQFLFSGNNDDHFKMGIKLTRAQMSLFAEFYHSDIIVASPLGLITKLQDSEADFLSSIEVTLLDGADVMLMQNWSHVKSVFESLNQQPGASHEQNLMRVREWYLDGSAARYRQNIVLSSFPCVEVNALMRQCSSHAGQAKVQRSSAGVLSLVVPQASLPAAVASPEA
ncbi:hypothetical protein CYMTET_20470 [Cymbomonas tetramitiformis]|uniref:UTP25 NTP hydrolase-like domain-containing protein n=2 Tax=Cymbomonas tetramitiformis TaxID=36881 RepID=A0AAE0G4H0_9CHLO|nr:hypothetical protein CYMTET_20470 [Cymbomonas tetramitiformis]